MRYRTCIVQSKAALSKGALTKNIDDDVKEKISNLKHVIIDLNVYRSITPLPPIHRTQPNRFRN